MMMNDQEKEKNIERAFFKALKNSGYVFPETEKDFDKFEESVLKIKDVIPNHLEDPIDILNRGKIRTLGVFEDFFDSTIEENLAQAAREGSDIPEDVWKQMEKDRQRSEDKNDGEDTQ
ncbi:hypothetical protein ACXYMT_04190 [Salinimicrobium sp. CAU 1759]